MEKKWGPDAAITGYTGPLMTLSREAFKAGRRGSLQQTSIAHRDQQYTLAVTFPVDFNAKPRRPCESGHVMVREGKSNTMQNLAKMGRSSLCTRILITSAEERSSSQATCANSSGASGQSHVSSLGDHISLHAEDDTRPAGHRDRSRQARTASPGISRMAPA